MNTPLSPIESEFETAEQAESHDRWFRAKVEEALADPRPLVPHDEVIADIRQTIANAQKQ
ncbi:antitoxin [Caballeronia sp. GaOx3]|uniref:type II toxin-antitoxin system RelB family antitoxin n=1 Tax=Caballeronia sp. GaOx3 TaxID=2921740 RepID=UPI0020281F95|nr:antitoxin [Caballeronia sp. GaOx3]